MWIQYAMLMIRVAMLPSLALSMISDNTLCMKNIMLNNSKIYTFLSDNNIDDMSP